MGKLETIADGQSLSGGDAAVPVLEADASASPKVALAPADLTIKSEAIKPEATKSEALKPDAPKSAAPEPGVTPKPDAAKIGVPAIDTPRIETPKVANPASRGRRRRQRKRAGRRGRRASCQPVYLAGSVARPGGGTRWHGGGACSLRHGSTQPASSGGGGANEPG